MGVFCAAAAAAEQLRLQLVDYAALREPFMAGQSYLGDLIHPNKEVIRGRRRAEKGLQWVDYAALGEPFMAGQSYRGI